MLREGGLGPGAGPWEQAGRVSGAWAAPGDAGRGGPSRRERPEVSASAGAARGESGHRCSSGGCPGWGEKRRRGERKRATCSCDRGFDLHPGSGHSPFQGELERLGDTTALCPPGSSSHWPLGVTSTYKLGRIEMQISFFSI